MEFWLLREGSPRWGVGVSRHRKELQRHAYRKETQNIPANRDRDDRGVRDGSGIGRRQAVHRPPQHDHHDRLRGPDERAGEGRRRIPTASPSSRAAPGKLVRGDVLVSNFNNRAERAGDRIEHRRDLAASASAACSPSFRAPPGDAGGGLTTALVALRSGVRDRRQPARAGRQLDQGAGRRADRSQLARPGGRDRSPRGDINGPWDMTAVDHGSNAVLFVTNVLNGTVAANGQGRQAGHGGPDRTEHSAGGATPTVTSNQVIATGFTEHTDPNALVVGPTGVGLGRRRCPVRGRFERQPDRGDPGRADAHRP